MKKKMGIFFLFLICFQMSLSARMGSLYKVESSPFRTAIAEKAGDLLTIVVVEASETEDTGQLDQTKKHELDFNLQKLFFPHFKMNKGFDDTALTGDTPGIQMDSENKFNANATSNATHSIETKFQARIVEEVSSGQFVIRGQRRVRINGKDKTVFLSGVINQTDIADDNSIESHLIADAVIELDGDVVVKDLQPGYIGSFISKIFF